MTRRAGGTETRWRLVAVLVLAAAVALAGCTRQSAAVGNNKATTSTSTSPSPSKTVSGSLSSAQMAAIVTTTMATNNRANRSNDTPLLETYETGSALAIDAASYAEAAGTTASACSYLPFTIKVLEAAELGGGSYPRRFVVLGSSLPLAVPKGCKASTGSCPNADSVFEFEQAAPGAHWKIVLEPTTRAGRIVELAADGTESPALSATERAAAGRLPAAIVSALSSYQATGHLGPLQASDFTSTCFVLPDPRAAFEQYAKSKVTSRQSYAPAPDEVSLGLAGNRTLTLFTLSFMTTLVPESGTSIEWFVDPSAEPVTALMPAGQYTRIVEKGSLELAAETGAGGGFSILGAYSGVTSVTGTMAPSSPGGGGGSGVLVSDVTR